MHGAFSFFGGTFADGTLSCFGVCVSAWGLFVKGDPLAFCGVLASGSLRACGHLAKRWGKVMTFLRTKS